MEEGTGGRPPLIHLSMVVGGGLLDSAGQRVGAIADLTALLEDENAPISGAVATVSGCEVYVPANEIAGLDANRIRLTGSADQLQEFQERPGEVRLRKQILDRKLISLPDRRLIRVNEIELMFVDGWYQVAGVDSGPRGYLRRLLPRFLAGLVSGKGFSDWANLEPFTGQIAAIKPHSRPRLRRLHPAELADLIEASAHAEGKEIIEAFQDSPALDAEVFAELDRHHQLEFIKERSNPAAADLLAHMQPDDAADLIRELPEQRQLAVFAQMPVRLRHEIRQLLDFPPTTAGGLMTPRFVCIYRRATKAQAVDRLTQSTVPADALGYLYIMNEHRRLRGAIAIPDLLRAQPDQPLATADDNPVRIRADAGLEELARLMADYNLNAIPVVDDKERMIGVVTIGDILQLLLPKGWRRRFNMLS